MVSLYHTRGKFFWKVRYSMVTGRHYPVRRQCTQTRSEEKLNPYGALSVTSSYGATHG
jgi:hypothetical protein